MIGAPMWQPLRSNTEAVRAQWLYSNYRTLCDLSFGALGLKSGSFLGSAGTYAVCRLCESYQSFIQCVLCMMIVLLSVCCCGTAAVTAVAGEHKCRHHVLAGLSGLPNLHAQSAPNCVGLHGASCAACCACLASAPFQSVVRRS